MATEQNEAEALHDVIVVGGGLAGCFATWELARAGLDVLVTEQHAPLTVAAGPVGFRAKIIRKLYPDLTQDHGGDRWFGAMEVWSDEPRSSRRPLRIPAMLGRGLGGSSIIYGGALGRMRRSDFERDDASARGKNALSNDWPFGYEDLSPWYRRAERLMEVRGTLDPLDPDDDADLREPPPLSPQDHEFVRALQANGLNPFRLHVAIRYRPGCSECLGVRCPRNCKSNGENRALRPALATGRVRLVTGFNVRAIQRIADGVLEVASWPDQDGRVRRRRARRVMLAAGALNTPLVLARSASLWEDGLPPALLGRGLMFHGGDIFAAFARKGASAYGAAKTLAFRDLYRVNGEPLGEVQSMGIRAEAGMISAWLQQEAHGLGLGTLGPLLEFARIPAEIGAGLFREAAMFAGILEDFPYRANRVFEGSTDGSRSGAITVVYQSQPELLDRARRLRREIRAAFRPNGVFFLSRLGLPNWGHPMGTCRMGAGSDDSVTDANGRVHGLSDVYVADASTFPSSAGVNPSLTIIANAMRIAAAMAGVAKVGRIESATDRLAD